MSDFKPPRRVPLHCYTPRGPTPWLATGRLKRGTGSGLPGSLAIAYICHTPSQRPNIVACVGAPFASADGVACEKGIATAKNISLISLDRGPTQMDGKSTLGISRRVGCAFFYSPLSLVRLDLPLHCSVLILY
jgi:hypothetical protein